jgi:hypothetical protein
MMAYTGGLTAAFTLGFFYFVGAVPAGVAAGLTIWLAALTAWLGYTAGAAVMLLLGAPARSWVARKLRWTPKIDLSSKTRGGAFYCGSGLWLWGASKSSGD